MHGERIGEHATRLYCSAASMRPHAYAWGKMIVSGSQVWIATGFNEAPRLCMGKDSQDLESFGACVHGFNEAPRLCMGKDGHHLHRLTGAPMLQ